MDNPFVLFPAEVWEMILNSMEDSNDIIKTVQAFPELKGVLKKNNHVWLFDKIIPHLFVWLPTEELLNCRATCTRWVRGIDTFLEEHPSLRANVPGEPLNISPRHYDLQDYFSTIEFSLIGKMDKFLEYASKHPFERNPFVGRSIRFAPCPNRNDVANMRRFWKVAKVFLTVFGKHVWYIDIWFSNYPLHVDSFCELFFDLLSRLPNLKRLDIMGPTTITFANQRLRVPGNLYQKHLLNSIPPLPHLETLNVDDLPPFIVSKMMTRFSQQIRKLSMDLSYYEGELPTALTELTITEKYDIKEVEAFLKGIKSENLVSLKVIYEGGADSQKILAETNIIPCFLGLPRLQRLEWKCPGVSVREFGILCPPKYPIPLKSLMITDNKDLGYDFLRNMSSLEYLKIVNWYPEQIDDDGSIDSTFSTTIRECIYEMATSKLPCYSDIWELLPNLKAVTLIGLKRLRIGEFNDRERFLLVEFKNYYSRDAYEYGKRMAGLPAA